MHLFHSLKDIITQYLPEHEVDIIREAYVVARDAHDGQMRSSGEPYIIHPVAVARLLADMRLDHVVGPPLYGVLQVFHLT